MLSDCSQLTAPLDGELSTHAVASGTVVTVSCFPGYTLFDHEPLQCQDGTWKGSLGTCKKGNYFSLQYASLKGEKVKANMEEKYSKGLIKKLQHHNFFLNHGPCFQPS